MTEEHGRADNVSSGTTVDPKKSIGADSKGEPRWLLSV